MSNAFIAAANTLQAMPMTWWAGWAGFVCGALGAGMLALNTTWSRWGWLAFLGSNIAWITYAALSGPTSLFLQQLVFIATTFLGISRWLLKPRGRITKCNLHPSLPPDHALALRATRCRRRRSSST